MTRWLMLGALVPLATGQAQAAPKPNGISSPARMHPAVDFRVVQDPVFDSTTARHSGMATLTDVAPNASVGFGMISISPRQAVSGENDARMPHSKKAAIKLTLRF
jgi:hypothetical protein